MTVKHPASKLGSTLATINEACEYFGVDRGTVRRWIADGTLTAYRVGPHLVRIDLDSIKAVRIGSDAE